MPYPLPDPVYTWNTLPKNGTYLYQLHPLLSVQQYFAQSAYEDAYRSDDVVTRQIAQTLTDGYRWVRDSGDWAVFEKEL